MTQEEKAKAYDEALERARQFSERPLLEDSGNIVEYIFPELKESEDERIRKAVIESVKTLSDSPLKVKMLAWLEKQGEQKSNDIRTTGYWLVEDIEQKPEWSEEDLCNIERCITKVEIDKSKWENNSKAKTMVDADDELIFWLKSLKDKCLPQPKQEWSEEDESNLDSAIYYIRREPYCESNVEPIVDWLRHLKDRVQPQQQEWSEEDVSLCTKIQEILSVCRCYNLLSPDLYKKMYDWLKSLRPQNWTKEDKERYISCLQRLSTGNPEQPETINSKWFKEHVYPQATWKPSDEQIGMLNEVLNFAANHESPHWNDYIFGTLNNLIKQLKKL